MDSPKNTNEFDTLKNVDRYELKDRIGAGGMGTIFRGFDPKLKRGVAIKLISDRVKDPSVRATIRERFFNEARAAGSMSHPNLVQIYDFNEIEGLSYIVMELIEGETLDELLKSKGPLNNEELIRIAREISSGLGYAHKKGVVHRDVKPSNVILEAHSGLSKILDFGIAKFVDENEMKLTSTGMVLGSTHYLSPEHITGKGLDGRSDLFCLGTLLYEAATGVLPFRGQNSSTILYKIVHFDPQPPAELRAGIDPRFSAIIMRLLRKAPQERYQNADELEKDLQELQGSLRHEKRTSGSQVAPSQVTKPYFVRDSQLLSALQVAKRISATDAANLRGKNVVELLTKQEGLSEDELSKTISECLSLPWISRGRLRALRVQPEAFDTVDSNFIRKFNILPFFKDDAKKTLSFLIDGTKDFQKDEEFAELAGVWALQFYVGGRSSIQRLIDAQFDLKAGIRKTRTGLSETGDRTLEKNLDEQRILLVDPQATSQEALIKLFKGNETAVVICSHLEEAMAKLRREPFDFVWANIAQIGDELQFESAVLKQNPNCDIRYYEHLGQEIFQETVDYRRFREFFHRLTQKYLSAAPSTHRNSALSAAALSVKIAQGATQVSRQLDEVYFGVLFWKLDRHTAQGSKTLELFDGVYRLRYLYDCLGERIDGRGNMGLRDDQIPLGSRVIATLSIIETLKQDLDAPWTESEFAELKSKFAQYNGKQLDPRLTSAALEALRPEQVSAPKSGRIVIVDSDAQFAAQLAAQLKQLANETIVYPDGLAALAGIKKDHPDLVISEVLISKLDGFALCARLRSDESLKDIPIVFLSESGAPEHSTKALQLGAEDFLQKTLDSQFIIAKLERMLKRSSRS